MALGSSVEGSELISSCGDLVLSLLFAVHGVDVADLHDGRMDFDSMFN